MLNVLIRTLGLTFYKQHAGLFAVIFYLLFGMINGNDLINFHVALLIAIYSSPIKLLILFLVWILYSLKCVHFVKQKLALQEYGFLKVINILSKRQQLITWFKLYAFLLIPILAYAVFVLIISIKYQYYFSLIVVAIQLLIIFGALITYTFSFTNYTYHVSKEWIILPKIIFNKPFWTWPIFYLLNEQRIVFLGCKIVSILFLKAILLVFADVGNDVRVYLTAILAVVLSHSVLVLNLVKFDANYLSFVKHLQITARKRFYYWALNFLILLLPELLLLLVITEINLLGFIYCVLLAIGGMLFLQMLVYNLKADMERYMKYLLFFFFAAMIAILADYYMLFSVVCIGVSVFMFLWRDPKIDLKEIAE